MIRDKGTKFHPHFDISLWCRSRTDLSSPNNVLSLRGWLLKLCKTQIWLTYRHLSKKKTSPKKAEKWAFKTISSISATVLKETERLVTRGRAYQNKHIILRKPNLFHRFRSRFCKVYFNIWPHSLNYQSNIRRPKDWAFKLKLVIRITFTK